MGTILTSHRQPHCLVQPSITKWYKSAAVVKLSARHYWLLTGSGTGVGEQTKLLAVAERYFRRCLEACVQPEESCVCCIGPSQGQDSAAAVCSNKSWRQHHRQRHPELRRHVSIASSTVYSIISIKIVYYLNIKSAV